MRFRGVCLRFPCSPWYPLFGLLTFRLVSGSGCSVLYSLLLGLDCFVARWCGAGARRANPQPYPHPLGPRHLFFPLFHLSHIPTTIKTKLGISLPLRSPTGRSQSRFYHLTSFHISHFFLHIFYFIFFCIASNSHGPIG